MPFQAYDVEGRTVTNKKTHKAGFADGADPRDDALTYAAELHRTGEFHRVIVLGPTELDVRDDEDIVWDSRVNAPTG